MYNGLNHTFDVYKVQGELNFNQIKLQIQKFNHTIINITPDLEGQH